MEKKGDRQRPSSLVDNGASCKDEAKVLANGAVRPAPAGSGNAKDPLQTKITNRTKHGKTFVFRADFIDGERARGIVAVLVKDCVFHEHVELTTELQAVALCASLPVRLTECSWYLPSGIRINMRLCWTSSHHPLRPWTTIMPTVWPEGRDRLQRTTFDRSIKPIEHLILKR